MTRVRSILGQWGLLAVGLLGAALLALRALHAPVATLPAGFETYHGAQVYGVYQVLNGVCLHPELWTGRTILVRGDESDANNNYLLAASPVSFAPPPCMGTLAGPSDTLLYEDGYSFSTLCSQRFPCDVEDPRTDPLNPANPNATSTPPGAQYRIYRTTLISSPDCGTRPHTDSCLVAEGARLVSRS